MQKYIIKYINHDDDLCTVWLCADSRDETEAILRAEYHDIRDLLSIKLKRE